MPKVRRIQLSLVGILSLSFSLHSSASVFAADPLSVQAQVDRSEVKEGERLTFSVTITGPIRGTPKLHLGSLEGFQVVSTGRSQQIQMRGREISQALTLTYLLVPTQRGTFTLGPVKVEYQGQTYETQPIQVKVAPGPAGWIPKSRRPAPERLPRLEGGVIL